MRRRTFYLSLGMMLPFLLWALYSFSVKVALTLQNSWVTGDLESKFLMVALPFFAFGFCSFFYSLPPDRTETRVTYFGIEHGPRRKK